MLNILIYSAVYDSRPTNALAYIIKIDARIVVLTDAGRQPLQQLFDSVVNNTLFHISPYIHQLLLKFL